MKANGTWGSVCTLGTLISDLEATVICRQLKFKDGYEIVFPTYKPLNGTVWLTNVNCRGNETNLKDCMLSGFGEQVEDKCLSHKYDLAVKCYSDGKNPASILRKSTSGRLRPVSYSHGPMTARYRFT